MSQKITVQDGNLTLNPLTGSIVTDSTGSIQLPSGTTAQRPSTSVEGMIRLNTDLGTFETFIDAEWTNTPLQTGATLQFEWKFDDADTAETDPGSKYFKMDSATPASVTEFYISETAEKDADLGVIFNFLQTGNRFYVQESKDSSTAILCELSGTPTDNTGWWTFPVTIVDSAGTLFADDNKCGFAFNFGSAGGGGGTVTSSGAPLVNEIAVFTTGTDIASDATFTWNGSTVAITGAVDMSAGTGTLTTAIGTSSVPAIQLDVHRLYKYTTNRMGYGIGGTTYFEWNAGAFASIIEGGAYMKQGNSTAAACGLSFTGDLNTGLHRRGVDEVSLTAGGIELVSAVETGAAGTTHVRIGLGSTLYGALATPALSFSDGDTGFYESADDVFVVVAGSVAALTLDGTGTSIIQSHEANVGLTADSGSAQGNGVITSTYNTYTVVATAGDAATLPATAPVGTLVYVKNDDSAESMDVFPASGDTILPNSVNVAEAVAAGESAAFLCTIVDDTWTKFIVGGAGGGGGTVTSSGAPLINEVAVFSTGTNILSDSTFTWNGTTLAVTGAITVDSLTIDGTSVASSGTLSLLTNASENAVVATTNADVALYHNAIKRFGTEATGAATLFSDTNTDGEIRVLSFAHQNGTQRAAIGYTAAGATFYIRSEIDGAPLSITGTDNGSFVRPFLYADPDAATSITGDTDIQLYNSAGVDLVVKGFDGARTGIYYDGTEKLRTALHTAPDQISGAELVDAEGNFQPAGVGVVINDATTFNTAATHTPFQQTNATQTVYWVGTGTSNFDTYASTGGSQTDIPVGTMWYVQCNGSGTLVIRGGSAVTIRYWDASGAPADADVTVARGGVATVRKVTDAIYDVWGIGLS